MKYIDRNNKNYEHTEVQEKLNDALFDMEAGEIRDIIDACIIDALTESECETLLNSINAFDKILREAFRKSEDRVIWDNSKDDAFWIKD